MNAAPVRNRAPFDHGRAAYLTLNGLLRSEEHTSELQSH